MEALSKGYCNVWSDKELAEMAKTSKPLAQKLADALIDNTLPERGQGSPSYL